MLTAGAGIGTGILTIPYAINKIGVWGTLIALIISFVVSAIFIDLIPVAAVVGAFISTVGGTLSGYFLMKYIDADKFDKLNTEISDLKKTIETLKSKSKKSSKA